MHLKHGLYPIKLLLFFGLFLSLYGTAQFKNGHNSFLWEMRQDGHTLYLLGSIHIAKQNLFPLAPAIEHAYESADAIAVEVDLNLAARTIPALIQTHAFLPPSTTVREFVSPESFSLLTRHLKSIRQDYTALSHMKPWYLALIISNHSMESIGARSYLGIDHYFIDKAYREKKPVIELEGAAMQIGMMEHLPMKEQEMLMVSAIHEAPDIETTFEAMVDLWNRGDTEAMNVFLDGELKEYPELREFNEGFIRDRNRQLTEKITALFKQKETILVIIGVAHFVGDEGIVRLLEAKGFSLIQR